MYGVWDAVCHAWISVNWPVSQWKQLQTATSHQNSICLKSTENYFKEVFGSHFYHSWMTISRILVYLETKEVKGTKKKDLETDFSLHSCISRGGAKFSNTRGASAQSQRSRILEIINFTLFA